MGWSTSGLLWCVLLLANTAAGYPPLSSVRTVHSELCDDAQKFPGGAKMATRMAAAAVPKVVRKVIPAPRPHWVGNGFHVFPVFGELAFTEELSPWLMFDYAAPKVFEPSTTRRGVGQVCCMQSCPCSVGCPLAVCWGRDKTVAASLARIADLARLTGCIDSTRIAGSKPSLLPSRARLSTATQLATTT
jgi:hypothetical protein